jgi:type I restriction enzyme S subunit
LSQFDELPEGWTEVRFGEAITLKRGFDLPKQNRQPGSFPIYAANGPVGTHEEAKVKGPGVVTGRSGTIGKVHYIEEDFWPLNTALFIEDFHGNDPKFCAHLLRNTDLKKFSSSTAIPTLNRNIVHESDVALPPLNEQRRIVEKVEALTTRSRRAREALAAIPELLDQFRQSVLAAAFRGDLTADWREQNPDVEPAEALLERIRETSKSSTSKKKTKLKSIEDYFDSISAANLPEAWKLIQINSICLSSFYGPRFSKDEYTSDGIPSIRTTDMQGFGKIEITDDTPRISIPPEKLEIYKVIKNDLLVTRSGSVGIMAIFKDDYLAIPSAYLIRFRFMPLISVEYIFLYLQSPIGQNLLGLSSTAVTQSNINAEAIKSLPIPLCSQAEQAEIIKRVNKWLHVIDWIQEQYQDVVSEMGHLDQSILAKAFRGELVPQDPTDEPAAVLLERIRAERDKLNTQRQGKKTPARRKKATP